MIHLGGINIQDPDAVIAVVGLNNKWETEGYDRTTLSLPGRTDELIERVAAVNAKTIVVTLAVCCLHIFIFKKRKKLEEFMVLDRVLQ